MNDASILLITKNQLFIAGLIGALIGAAFKRQHGPFTVIFSVFGGLAASYYLAPTLIDYYPSFSPEMISFLVGLVGMNALTSIISASEYVTKNVAMVVGAFINKRLGKDVFPVDTIKKGLEKESHKDLVVPDRRMLNNDGHTIKDKNQDKNRERL